MDLVSVLVVESAAVEDEEQLVALVPVRGPIDDEQRPEGRVDAQLFAYFPDAGIARRFADFNVSTEDVLRRLVGRAYAQKPIVLVAE